MTQKKSIETSKDDTESKLSQEFERIKRLLEIAGLTRVVWRPNNSGNLCGEVKNKVVYIYECDGYKALEILRHEMIDYQITSFIIKPLLRMINMLIKLREQDIYLEKERIVENLSRLLDQ